MPSAHTAAAVRAAEQPLLDAGQGPGLMRLASHGLAMGVVSTLRARGAGIYGSQVVLLVGSGNNGGDALYAGAFLAGRGAGVTAILTGSRTHPEALAAFEKAGGRWLTLAGGAAGPGTPGGAGGTTSVAGAAALAGESGVVVDGFLGTGGRGGLRGEAAELVSLLKDLAGPGRPAVVACDLPSGVDATTGEVYEPVLRADLTVTFGAHKSGLLAAPGEQLCGTVELVDLGIGQYLAEPDVVRLSATDIASLLPAPGPADHKYTRGVAGIVAGSGQYPGAALLATAAASACGPGMVRYLGPAGVAAAIHVRNPEIVCSEQAPDAVRVQAWLAGPGIDGDAEQLDRARLVLAFGLPTVVDAGALELVDATAPNAHLVLTPHAGELAALFHRCGGGPDRAAIEASPLAAARSASALTGAVVLLKGPTTVVAEPSGTAFTQANGTARLATAGSGDTLAGILVALLAMDSTAPDRALDPVRLARTAALAAAVHGELSRPGPDRPLHAGMLAERIPGVWARLAATR